MVAMTGLPMETRVNHMAGQRAAAEAGGEGMAPGLPAADEVEVAQDVADFEESDSDALPRLFDTKSMEPPQPVSDVPPPSTERQTLSLRSQLADLFGMNASPAASPEAQTQKPDESPQSDVGRTAAASEPPETQVTEPAEPADPIRLYMEQLLARNRKSAPQEKVRVQPPDPITVSQQQPQASANAESLKPRSSNTEWLAQGPTHKQDKDAVRANMQQLRALANQQARAAVVRAGKKQMRLQLMTKAGAALMSLLFGGVALMLELPSIYGYACIGLGAFFTGDLVISVFRNSKTLSKQERLVQDGIDEETYLKSNSRTEGRLDQFTRSENSDSYRS